MDVHGVEGDQIDPGQGEQQHHGDEHGARHRQYPGQVGDEGEVQDQQHHVAQIHGDDHRPEDVRMLHEQTWARLDAVGHQGAQDEGRGAGARDPQGQQGHEGAGGGGVVGRFRGGQTAQAALAELLPFALAGDVALGPIGHEGGDGGAGSRQHADEKAQHRGAGDGKRDFPDLFLAQLEAAELLHLPCLFLAVVLAGAQHRHQDLREGKGGHGQQQEGEAVTQIRQPEGEPVHPDAAVDADGGDHDAEQRHDQRLEHLPLAGKGCHGGEAQHHEGEVVRRLEGEGDLGEQGRRHHQHDGGEGAAGEGGVGGDGQRLARLSLAGQGIAVEGGDHGGGAAGGVDQDGGGGAPEDGAVIDPRHQDDAGGRIQAIGDGDHQGDGGDRAKARQHADKGADEAAKHHHHQVDRQQCGAESLQDSV